MAFYAPLQPALDRGLLLSLLQQDALVEATDALGAHRWDVDTVKGELVFSSEQDPSRRLVAQAQLIASIAPGPRTILWDWAHPQGNPNGPTVALRRAGEAEGIRELSEGEVPFPAGFEVTDESLALLAHEIGQVATGILGTGPYYSAPIEGGTRFVWMLSAPLPPLTLATAVMKLPRMISTGLFRDARTSVWALATSQGWSFQWTDESFRGAVINDGVSTAQFTFNDLAQITNVHASATAS